MSTNAQMLKMRVHTTGRNQPERVADAPIPKSITPNASVAISAHRTPFVRKLYPGVRSRERISPGFVAARITPRMLRAMAKSCTGGRPWRRMRMERTRVKMELVEVSGLDLCHRSGLERPVKVEIAERGSAAGTEADQDAQRNPRWRK